MKVFPQDIRRFKTVQVDVQAIRWRLTCDGPDDAYWPEPNSAADLELAELETGLSIPESVSNFLLAGGFPDWFVVFTTWELLSLEFMVNLYHENLSLYGPHSPIQNENRWQSTWLPVASNNGGDYLFMDSASDGLFRYRHFDGDVIKVTDSFEQFIHGIREDLEQDRYVLSHDETPEYRGAVEIS
ncbi:SMI1/KNR4 family protein [Deinococcus sp.]|uniref:SMI1/KNR4 family protein n=1 Tax=Deinococcus sp. TaxID=47478 RepID=UPI00391AC4F0